MKRWLLPTLGLFIVLAAYFYYENSKITAADTDSASKIVDVTAEKNALTLKSNAQKNTNNVRGEQFTLYGSNDYAALKAYYEPLAEKGDPYARRVIAQIYEYCVGYSRSPKMYTDTINDLIRLKPENKVRLLSIKSKTEQRCALLDNGLPITKELIDFSWAQASEAKDSLATLKIATQLLVMNPDKAPQGKALNLFIDKAINEADPETLFATGELLSLNNSSSAYHDLSGPINGYAWQIAACRRGGTSMCGPSSNLMSSVCTGLGDCTSANFEAAIRYSTPPSQASQLNDALVHIENFLHKKGLKK
ncbi:MAG: hypothetical protein ACREO1_08685 [Arenimonas sp.]